MGNICNHVYFKKQLCVFFCFSIQVVYAQDDIDVILERVAKEAAKEAINKAADEIQGKMRTNYTPTTTRGESSSSITGNQSQVMGNISVTVGLGGIWTFKFFSNGTFQSHVWYGNEGKYSRKGTMRKESYSNGTYTIIKENGKNKVHLRYANGYETTEELVYEGSRVKLLTDFNGVSWKAHKQIDN